jgi:hypothetical protein
LSERLPPPSWLGAAAHSNVITCLGIDAKPLSREISDYLDPDLRERQPPLSGLPAQERRRKSS